MRKITVFIQEVKEGGTVFLRRVVSVYSGIKTLSSLVFICPDFGIPYDIFHISLMVFLMDIDAILQ